MTDKQEWLQCMKYVPGYEHDHASLSQMREYTHCVQVLHPVEPSGSSALIAGAGTLVLILSLVGVGRLVRGIRRKSR